MNTKICKLKEICIKKVHILSNGEGPDKENGINMMVMESETDTFVPYAVGLVQTT